MRPQRPPSINPNEERYWDPRDLEQELERVFNICHGCRMCVGYCPSFPELFKRVDQNVDAGRGEAEALDDQDFAAVNDLCYQCKLCYFKCPYTPDDDHAFAVDFPALMQRHKAQRARADGIKLEDRLLGEPEQLGRLGSGPAATMANLVTRNQLLRKVQQKATGISADFNLPPFAHERFEHWFARHTPQSPDQERGQVALFATCTVNFNMPAAGRAAVQVLEHNGFDVSLPVPDHCCGMPNLDGGDVPRATMKARQNVDAMFEQVQAGRCIVVPSPTCGYVMKHEYPLLLDGDPKAVKVSENTFDLMEFLRDRLRAKDLRTDFVKSLGRLAYHAPCHLRAQKVGFPSMQLLRKVPDTEVEVIEQCSAVDGTWGMKARYYELGRQYAGKLIQETRRAEAQRVTSDCPLSALRLSKELGTETPHPIELLNEAYGLPPAIDPRDANLVP